MIRFRIDPHPWIRIGIRIRLRIFLIVLVDLVDLDLLEIFQIEVSYFGPKAV
jgi:hypothetical protein